LPNSDSRLWSCGRLNPPNRRMRTRMYGGVAGEAGRPVPLCRLASRRSGYWLKVKVHQEEEFVMMGFTAPHVMWASSLPLVTAITVALELGDPSGHRTTPETPLVRDALSCAAARPTTIGALRVVDALPSCGPPMSRALHDPLSAHGGV
jgi:hypothetical protein